MFSHRVRSWCGIGRTFSKFGRTISGDRQLFPALYMRYRKCVESALRTLLLRHLFSESKTYKLNFWPIFSPRIALFVHVLKILAIAIMKAFTPSNLLHWVLVINIMLKPNHVICNEIMRHPNTGALGHGVEFDRGITVCISIANLRFPYYFKNTSDRRRSQVDQNVLRSAIVCHYTNTKLYGDSIQNQLHQRTAVKISGQEVDLQDSGSIRLSPQMEVLKVRIRSTIKCVQYEYENLIRKDYLHDYCKEQ